MHNGGSRNAKSNKSDEDPSVVDQQVVAPPEWREVFYGARSREQAQSLRVQVPAPAAQPARERLRVTTSLPAVPASDLNVSPSQLMHKIADLERGLQVQN